MEITKEFFEELELAISQNDAFSINHLTAEMHYADISVLLYEMNTEQAIFVLKVLDKETVAEILTELDAAIRVEFLEDFSSEQLAEFVDLMDSDDAVDLLKEQQIRKREEVIAIMKNREKARNIIHLLPFEEGTAGAMMARELIKANINWNIKQCIEEIRRQAEKVEQIYAIYVVDNEGILQGRVSIKKIILSADDNLVADIYEEDVISVEVYKSQEEIAEIMQKYDLESIPVVNVKGKLLGRITIDDVIDVIKEQADADRQAMSGLSGDIEEDDTVWDSIKARLPWLIIGMGGGMLAASLTNILGQPVLVLASVLANFMSLIAGTGGNVGVQSSSIILQSLANKSVFQLNTLQRLSKVLVIALCNGLILAFIVLGASFFLGYDFKIGLIVAISLLSVVLLASLMGTITPLILSRFKINPALASGPFITTANDLLGLTVYFLVAKMLL
jgi:magnesium transporter